MAIDSNLGAVIGKEEGAVTSIPGMKEELRRHGWMCEGGKGLFSVYLWHSEGWTPRNEALMEAVVKQVRTTRHPWLTACDANMCPEDFKTSLWFRIRHIFIKPPREVSTCRSKGPKGEVIERTYDCVIVTASRGRSRIWWWKISNQGHTRRSLSW